MMTINITEQTTTFPVPLNKLKGRLMDNIGMIIQTPESRHELDINLVNWIVKNAITSQFNNDRCYVYNKAMSKFCAKCEEESCCNNNIDEQISYSASFDDIRCWAKERGIYKYGDTQTQFTKLMEEVGELAQGILNKDKPEIIDAIGDIVIVLTNLAKLEKLNIEDCIDNAYQTVSKRTGKMINGTFVKNTL